MTAQTPRKLAPARSDASPADPPWARRRRGGVHLGVALALTSALALATVQQSLFAQPAETPSPSSTPASAPAAEPLDNLRPRVEEPRPGDRVRLVLRGGGGRGGNGGAAANRALEGVVDAVEQCCIVVDIAGVSTSFDRESISALAILGTVLDEYRTIRIQIRDDDVESLLALVRWLQDRELYAQALFELDNIQRVEPNNPDALRLRRVIREQKRLQDKRLQRDDPQPPRDAGGGPTDGERLPVEQRRSQIPLLTPEQVNLIKVYEIDLAEPPSVVIERDTVERLLERHAAHPLIPDTQRGRDAFHRLEDERILDIMFRVGARELYSEVRVLGQPQSMRRFRDTVHRGWIANRCATTECHGGYTSEGLVLASHRPNTDQTLYTNFLILDRYRTRTGQALIDWESPSRSLLMQMALPRTKALFPHPDVPGWKPALRSRESRRFRQAVEWIESMYRPRPDYPIEYEPPTRGDALDRDGATNDGSANPAR
jgi:hypothetical protein